MLHLANTRRVFLYQQLAGIAASGSVRLATRNGLKVAFDAHDFVRLGIHIDAKCAIAHNLDQRCNSILTKPTSQKKKKKKKK